MGCACIELHTASESSVYIAGSWQSSINTIAGSFSVVPVIVDTRIENIVLTGNMYTSFLLWHDLFLYLCKTVEDFISLDLQVITYW